MALQAECYENYTRLQTICAVEFDLMPQFQLYSDLRAMHRILDSSVTFQISGSHNERHGRSMSYEQAAAERLLNHHGDADAPTRYAKRRANPSGGVLISVRAPARYALLPRAPRVKSVEMLRGLPRAPKARR